MNPTRAVAVILTLAALTGCATPTPTPPPTATVTSSKWLIPAETIAPTPTPVPPDYPMRLEQVGQFGGYADALALHGDMIYLKVGQRLVSVNVSDPTNPTITGFSPFIPDAEILSVGAFGDYALAGDSNGVLWIFTAPQEGNSELVASIKVSNIIADMVVSEPYVYLAAGIAGLVIVDLSDLAQPKIVGAHPVDGHPSRLAKAGSLIVIGSAVMTMIDVSDPTQPSRLSWLLPGHSFYSITISENTVYVGERDGTSIYDISDPAAPKLISRNDGITITVAVNGLGVGYDEEGDQFHPRNSVVYDISHLPEITEVTSGITPLPEGEVASSQSLAVRDRFAYAAHPDGLEIFDLGLSPERVVIFPLEDIGYYEWKRVGDLDTNVGTFSTGCCVVILPPICVVEARLSALRGLWSLSDPANPAPIPEPEQGRTGCGGFETDSGLVFSDSTSDGTLLLFDTRDPANPSEQRVSLGEGVGEGYVRAISHDKLFFYTLNRLADGNPSSDLLIFDISDPYYPKLLGSYSPVDWNYRTEIYPLGEHLYIDTGSSEFVLDISDPAHPQSIRTPDSYFFEAAIVIHDDVVFTIYKSQLKIFSTSDLHNPIAVVDVPDEDFSYYPYLSYQDGRLFADGRHLTIFDVSDPARPRPIARWDGNLREVAAYGDYVYVNMVMDGVGVFHLVPK